MSKSLMAKLELAAAAVSSIQDNVPPVAPRPEGGSIVSRKDVTKALEGYDPARFDPSPREDSKFKNIALPGFVQIIDMVGHMIEIADLREPREFHTLLNIVMGLGGDPKFVACEHGKTTAQVSLWVTGTRSPLDTSPEQHRRRAILASAYRSLRLAMDAKTLVPFKEYSDRRTKGAAAV